MSKDLQIAFACPHYTRYERARLDSGVYINTASPINGSGLIEIRRDGEILDPNGNIREAIITTPNVSPFRVRKTSNVLTITTTEGYTNTISLTPKIYSSTSLIAQIKDLLGNIGVKETKNKALEFSDGKLGVGFTLRGSLLKALGFSNQKQTVKTKRTTPSWNLYPVLNGYGIKFSKKLAPEGLLEVSYLTEKKFCRRCGGTGVENDFRFGVSGDVQKVQDTDLLYQNVAKILLTEIGSNSYHRWYGSNAMKLIGQKNNAALQVALRMSVQQALSKFQRLQQDLKKYQNITQEERLVSVQSVDVAQLNDNATAVLCNVVIKSGSNRPVSVNIVFSVPGAISLDGDLT